MENKNSDLSSHTIFSIENFEFDNDFKIKYGTNCSVRKAFLLDKNQSVAYKTYKTKNTSSYKNEIKILKNLDNENCLRLIGLVDDGFDSLITEWCSGPNLYEYLNSKCEEYYFKSSMFELMDIAYQVANAMEYLHSMRIVHRDLKSKNIFLTETNSDDETRKWQVKVGDFNLAICLDDKDVHKVQAKCEGSFYWMSPEVLNKNYNGNLITDPYSFKSDVYSFGIVLYELLTGELPFKDLDPMVVVLRVGKRSIKINYKPKPNTPKSAVELLEICTDFEREKRPQFNEIKLKLNDIKKESSRIPSKL